MSEPARGGGATVHTLFEAPPPPEVERIACERLGLEPDRSELAPVTRVVSNSFRYPFCVAWCCCDLRSFLQQIVSSLWVMVDHRRLARAPAYAYYLYIVYTS